MKKLLILVLIPFFINSCATNRGVIDLAIKAPEAQVNSNGKTIFIREVKDNRVFEEKPKNPATPSLGFGGAASTADDLKKRAIARKRGGYGKALGDIILPEGKNVESVIRESLTRSFIELGYNVIESSSDIDKKTMVIDVSIDKFWSWLNVTVWSYSIASDIETKITFNNSNKIKTISTQYTEGVFSATGKNWEKVMSKNLENFNNQTKESFSKE